MMISSSLNLSGAWISLYPLEKLTNNISPERPITMESIMLNIFKVQLLLILASFLVLPAMAENAPIPPSPEKYINVTFEIYGLDESAKLLKNASLDLAEKLSQLDPDPEEMSPEQLQALSSVIQEANRLMQSVDESINQTGLAVGNLVSDSLIAVNQSTIEPTIQSVDNSVTKWLIISFLSIFLLIVVVGYYFYLASKQIRTMVNTLKSITEDYEIVPKRTKE